MSNRPRIIERSEDDLVVGWPLEGQVACAAVFLVVLALICIKWSVS